MHCCTAVTRFFCSIPTTGISVRCARWHGERGTAPLITAVASILLLGQSPDGYQLAALVIVGVGIISLSFSKAGKEAKNNTVSALLAVITAAFISSYSLVDGIGARIGGTALGFYGDLTIINGGIYAGICRGTRTGMSLRVLKQNSFKALSGGGISLLDYSLVIWSFTKAPVALVAALRETSVIFPLLLGVFVLKERLTCLKIRAVSITLPGVILLRIG